GVSPMANSYVRRDQLNCMEPFFPLHAYVCGQCFLVQVEEFESPAAIFSNYAYFSSFSESWLAHAKAYVDSLVSRFQLGPQTPVVEIASNDGYLLQYFQRHSVPVLGVEPAANVAEVARQKGIPTISKFFGVETARELVAQGHRPQLIVANNVVAHVPDLNDFVAGFKELLRPEGIFSVQFQYLMPMVRDIKFDTMYHEHFSYFSLYTIEKVFAHHGLRVFDVEEHSAHGGSLRVLGCHAENANIPVSSRVDELRSRELAEGVSSIEFYASFPERVKELKRSLLEFLIPLKRAGKQIVGYGAPAKGNTLLNYCGIGKDFLDYTVDLNPAKQNDFLPGTHIPIYSPEKYKETHPDYILILPWNLADEIVEQTSYTRAWGAKYVVPVPSVRVLE
ncbi:MAG TPA: class I SAM-dependent methyltransferase, partial [Terriglobia bacterium]|nr:class I SAM-dependent methyltransferase [Terriglobia bacterium]